MPATPEARWRVQVANGAANGGALAYAGGLGLFEAIDRFRFRDPADPVPAPGMADLPDAIHAHALAAIHAAASCHILIDSLTDAEPDELDSIDAALVHASDRAQHAAFAAQRALRHLAQVGLGIAQHASEDDDVELIERMTIGVLAHDETGTAAGDDRFPLAGRTTHEISVELAGLIARALCDQSAGLDPEPSFTLGADDFGTIEIRLTDEGGVVVTGLERYAAPVTITEITARVLRAVTDADVDPARLQVHWAP